MPLRRHRPRQITFDDFHLFTFGSAEELTAGYGSLDRAEAVWRSVRDDFLARWKLWGMPEAWWRFEPGIPDDLRTGPALILSPRDADRWRELDVHRRRYLVSVGIDPAPDLDEGSAEAGSSS